MTFFVSVFAHQVLKLEIWKSPSSEMQIHEMCSTHAIT